MPAYAIDLAPVVGIPVADSDSVFPVRRVYCIGRNYAAHAVEMGHDPDREPPFFFQKNPNNLDPSGTFPYPPNSSDVHHETEMLVALKSGGTNIPQDQALDPRIRLRPFTGYDPSRFAGRTEEDGSPVGDWQSV